VLTSTPCGAQTWWGSPRVSIAERLLLREALKEPRNQRFLLLSDSDVPLYPPTVVWQQLMGEGKSRIDGCNRVRWSNKRTGSWQEIVLSAVQLQPLQWAG